VTEPQRRVWVGEIAGPLLLLPNCLLPEWSGIDVPEFRTVEATFRWNADEPRACDYDRACDMRDEVGVVPVGFGEGLVLSGGQRPTTWLPRSWGGIIARWEYGEGDDSVELALNGIPERLSWDWKTEFTTSSTPLEPFNSAEPGDERVMARLEIDLCPAPTALDGCCTNRTPRLA
jgi:hypothetical protein